MVAIHVFARVQNKEGAENGAEGYFVMLLFKYFQCFLSIIHCFSTLEWPKDR